MTGVQTCALPIFAYALYIHYGKCSFEFICDPKNDFDTFGGLITCMYTCKMTFDVEDNGDYKFYINHSFDHDTLEEINKEHYALERKRLDQSFNETFEKEGNISDWKTSTIQTKESIHEKKNKKEIKIYVK